MKKQLAILLAAFLSASTMTAATLKEPASSVAAIDTSGRLTTLRVLQKSVTAGPTVRDAVLAKVNTHFAVDSPVYGAVKSGTDMLAAYKCILDEIADATTWEEACAKSTCLRAFLGSLPSYIQLLKDLANLASTQGDPMGGIGSVGGVLGLLLNPCKEALAALPLEPLPEEMWTALREDASSVEGLYKGFYNAYALLPAATDTALYHQQRLTVVFVFNALLLNSGIMPSWRSILLLIPGVETCTHTLAEAGLSIEGATDSVESAADILSFDRAFDDQVMALLDDSGKLVDATNMVVDAIIAKLK